jgi:DNA-binding response OmpR family regulator
LIKKNKPDLILLDLGLPNTTGDTFCLEVKEKFPQIKVIILTGRDQNSDVVNGFKIGADDFIAKPFSSEVLLARIKARLSTALETSNILKYHDLLLNKDSLTVTRKHKKITLTPKEFQLLEYLMANPKRVLTREMILNRVWLYSPEIDSRVVDIFISSLRKEIDAGHKKKYIKSVRGFGYKFE